MNDDFETFKFTYIDDGRRITYECSEDVAFWPDVLQKFLDFMASVYGYDISKNIKVEHPKGFKDIEDNEDFTS